MNKTDKEMYESVIDKFDGHCALCGRKDIQLHHSFGGPNRPASTKFGLVIPLCETHHRMVHANITLAESKAQHPMINTFGWTKADDNEKLSVLIRKEYQKEFEQTHSREEFMKIFHKNYL